MKFSCSKESLLAILNQVARAIAVKPATPVLGGIYLKVTDNTLEIQANHYMLGMSASVDVSTAEKGEVVVIGKKFLDVVRAMPHDTLSFSSERGYLEISSGRSNYSIAMLNVEDFPKVTRDNTEDSFTIQSKKLKSLINKTVFACTRDDSYPLYMGCLFDIKDTEINVVATNMHRLAISKNTLQSAVTPMSFIVPGEILRSIAEMLPDDDSTIQIDYYGKNVAFEIDQVFVKARLIEGHYPDYRRVIPSSSATFIEVDADILREAVERLSIISKEDSHKKVTLNCTRDGLEIYAASTEIGNGVEVVPIDLKGAEVSISFNYVYINDVLKVLRDGVCRIALNGALDAADIRTKDADDYIYIVTPVRT